MNTKAKKPKTPPGSVDDLIAKWNKGGNDLILRGSQLKNKKLQRVTSGSLGIDLVLNGGWSLNSPHEILGYPSSGKTTLAVKTLAANMLVDPEYEAVWVQAEDFDYEWAQFLGMDMDRMTFIISNLMEEVYEAVLDYMTSRSVDALVIDSLPHLIPSEEWDKTMMEMTVGRGAYVTNKFLRKATAAARRSLIEEDRGCLFLLINQWRQKIQTHGDPKTSPGGQGKDFAAATRTEVSRIEWLKNGDMKVGQTMKVRNLKNKTGVPQREHTLDYYFHGPNAGQFDQVLETFLLATDWGALERAGAWYYFQDRKWNGKEKLFADMDDDPSLLAAIDNHVRHVFLGEPLDVPSTEVAATKRRKRRALS